MRSEQSDQATIAAAAFTVKPTSHCCHVRTFAACHRKENIPRHAHVSPIKMEKSGAADSCPGCGAAAPSVPSVPSRKASRTPCPTAAAPTSVYTKLVHEFTGSLTAEATCSGSQADVFLCLPQPSDHSDAGAEVRAMYATSVTSTTGRHPERQRARARIPSALRDDERQK